MSFCAQPVAPLTSPRRLHSPFRSHRRPKPRHLSVRNRPAGGQLGKARRTNEIFHVPAVEPLVRSLRSVVAPSRLGGVAFGRQQWCAPASACSRPVSGQPQRHLGSPQTTVSQGRRGAPKLTVGRGRRLLRNQPTALPNAPGRGSHFADGTFRPGPRSGRSSSCSRAVPAGGVNRIALIHPPVGSCSTCSEGREVGGRESKASGHAEQAAPGDGPNGRWLSQRFRCFPFFVAGQSRHPSHCHLKRSKAGIADTPSFTAVFK